MRFDTKMQILWFVLFTLFIISLVLLVVLSTYPIAIFILSFCLALSLVGSLVQSVVVVFSDGID